MVNMLKTTHILNCLFLLFWSVTSAQSATNSYDQVPQAFRSHPELGKTSHSDYLNAPQYELIQERTRFSRTFVNTNKTQTTVHSSRPMHYQASDGLWHTLDYSIASLNGKLSYPAQQPFIEIDGKNISVSASGQKINFKSQGSLAFLSADTNADSKMTAAQPVQTSGNSVRFENVLPGIHKDLVFFDSAFKYTYQVLSAAVIPQNFEKLAVDDIVELPSGFSIRLDPANRIVIFDGRGNEVMTFHQPALSDSRQGVRGMRQGSLEGKYELSRLNGNKYQIRILVDGQWLQSPDRVFPLFIDPVVTASNLDVVNSCFLPAYQQAALTVNVPAGQSVLTSNLSYDFIAVAGSGSWKADQRSFVAGPNGQTPIQNGVGNTDGLMTYNITNSEIGNTVSTGEVTFTFNFGRNWGGSGCSATYNFVNRREVVVTYGTIDYGDGPLLINEYSASNRNFNDGFGRNEDWIELYNASPDSYFNLAGYYLSDDADNPTKWQFDAGVIPPNSRVLVFCSERDISSGMVFHTSFDLDQLKPDQVVLADPSGNIVEALEMHTTQTNHSYGRTADGAGTWAIFTSPTPGGANTGGFTSYTSKPVFSIPAGKYPGAISVSLTANPGEQIRYTLNGATPTASSPLYTGPINISQSTVVRARAFSTSATILPGFIETNSYFINENSTLPVLSISGDANLLQLLNGNSGLEPLGYVEYFESDGTMIDENMGDFDRHGNDSWAYAQRGIDFISRDDHGYKRRMEHQFFPTTNRSEFRRLIFKAAGSDNYPHQSGGAHIRDAFVQTLSQVSDLDLDERSARFVSMFVNGQYWGVYDIREKVDDNQYTDYYYNQDYTFRDSDIYLQYIKTWGSTEPEFGNQPAEDDWQDLLDYVQDNDMAVEEHYNYVDSQLNIDSLIDYFVINSYMVNKDWLNYNTSWWRGTDPDGGARKWRYSLWDMDGVLGHYINFTGIPDISANAEPCQVEEIQVGVGHTQTIKKLIDESPIVRQRYVTRYADLLNTHLSCERVTQVFDSIVNLIAPEMPRQIQRWGGNIQTWQNNVQAARDFLLTRCSQTINTGLASCYELEGPFATTFNVEPASAGKIRMNSEWIANYPFSAQVFGNIETLLKAEANPGFEFSHWVVDGAVIQPDPESIDIVLQISQATSVTAHFIDLINNDDEVIYYWHFNTLDTPVDVTSIAPDYNHIPEAAPMLTYTGSGPRDIDANNGGSNINLHQNEGTGLSARVRNPSDGRSLVFDMPTTGYQDIRFAYAVQRTNQGQLINNISYSVDGTTFIQDGLAQSAFNVATDFSFVQVDFSALEAVDNNANFKVKIEFEGNTTADNGNNRFDNITLKGVEYQLSTPSQQLTTYQVFPNPFKHSVQVLSSEPMFEISIYDMLGKRIAEIPAGGTTSRTLGLATLNSGIYLLKIRTLNGMITHKIVKH